MKRNYWILIIVIIALSVGYFFYFSQVFADSNTNIKKLDKEIKVARQDLNSCKVQAEQLGGFTVILDHSLTKEKEFSSDEIHEMIEEMDALAHNLDINLSEIDHKDLFTKSDRIEHEFSFVFSTTYVKLGKFMNSLEKMDYLTVINSFEIEPIKTVQKKSASEIKVEDLDKKYSVNLSISFIKHKMR